MLGPVWHCDLDGLERAGYFVFPLFYYVNAICNTIEPQWLEHLWDHGNLFYGEFEPLRDYHSARL